MPFIRRVITSPYQGWHQPMWTFYLVFKIVILICQSKFIYDVRNDFSLFSLAAVTYFVPMMALSNTATLLLFRRKIDEMHSVTLTKFYDPSVVRDDLRVTISTRFRLIDLMMIAVFWSRLLLTTVIVMLPLGKYPDGKRTLPAVIWLPFDANPSPLHEFLYVILGVTHHLSILAMIVNDLMFVYFAQTLSVQFVVLKELLRNVCEVRGVRDEDKLNSAGYQEIINARLKECVNHHLLLIDFSRGIQKVFSFGLLLQFLVIIPLLVFTGFLLETDLSDVVKTGKLLMYATSLSLQIIMFAFNGSELEYQSETLANAAYNSRWYFGGKRFRTGLHILLMNGQKPVKISAMGMLYVNNPIIGSIYQTVGSVLTLIKKVFD